MTSKYFLMIFEYFVFSIGCYRSLFSGIHPWLCKVYEYTACVYIGFKHTQGRLV